MTDGTQPPAGYAAPPAPEQFAPRAARPPLESRARRGAAIAGAVAFNLLCLGFVMFAVPILLGFVAAVFGWAGGVVQRIDGIPRPEARRYLDVVDALDLDAWTVPLVIISVAGVVVMVLALLTSVWVLRAHGVGRQWAITWAGAGVATLASVVLGSIVSGIVQLVTSSVFGSTGDAIATVVATLVVSVALAVVVNAAFGWLSWWWMTHAMRPAQRVLSGDPASDDAQTPASAGDRATVTPGEQAPLPPLRA